MPQSMMVLARVVQASCPTPLSVFDLKNAITVNVQSGVTILYLSYSRTRWEVRSNPHILQV